MTKKAAKYGLLDKWEADPILWTLFQLIFKWNIEGRQHIVTFFVFTVELYVKVKEYQ